MKLYLGLVLVLFGLGCHGVALNAQVPAVPKADTAQEDPYKNLPAEKEFDMGKLEEEYNTYFSLIENAMASMGALQENRYHKYKFYARRMDFFAKHPYIEKATNIKSEWIGKVANGLRYIGEQLAECERGEMLGHRTRIKNAKANAEKARSTFEAFLKKPEKVKKGDKDGDPAPAVRSARPPVQRTETVAPVTVPVKTPVPEVKKVPSVSRPVSQGRIIEKPIDPLPQN